MGRKNIKFVGIARFLILLVFCNMNKFASSTLQSVSKIIASMPREEGKSEETQTCNLSVVSWNMAEKTPLDKDAKFLQELRSSDIVVFGIQECEDIKPRRNEGHRTRRWKKIQSKALGGSFDFVTQHKMGGLMITVYVNRIGVKMIDKIQLHDVACGVGNVLTNKGAVSVIMRINGKTLALINAHMAAHQTKVSERNADFDRIMSAVEKSVPKEWKINIPDEIDESSNEISAKSKKISGKMSKKERRKRAKKTLKSFEKKSSYPSFSGMVKTLTSHVPDSIKKNSKKLGNSLLKATSRKGLATTSFGRKLTRGKSKIVVKKTKKAKKRTEYQFDGIVFFGDLNYRVDLPRRNIERFHKKYKTITQNTLNGTIESDIYTNNSYLIPESDYEKYQQDFSKILINDQLSKQISKGKAFFGFKEGNITFPPTFKYDVGARIFDSSAKARCPAWTDRVLFFTQPSKRATNPHSSLENSSLVSENSTTSDDIKPFLDLKRYYSVDATTSDHRPVIAQFTLNI